MVQISYRLLYLSPHTATIIGFIPRGTGSYKEEYGQIHLRAKNTRNVLVVRVNFELGPKVGVGWGGGGEVWRPFQAVAAI